MYEKTVYTINLQLCKCINWKFFFSTSITTCIITNFSLVKNSWNCDINHFVCEWIFPCDPIMRFCSFWNCVSKTLLLSRKQMVCSRFFFFLLYILIYCMCERERERRGIRCLKTIAAGFHIFGRHISGSFKIFYLEIDFLRVIFLIYSEFRVPDLLNYIVFFI